MSKQYELRKGDAPGWMEVRVNGTEAQEYGVCVLRVLSTKPSMLGTRAVFASQADALAALTMALSACGKAAPSPWDEWAFENIKTEKGYVRDDGNEWHAVPVEPEPRETREKVECRFQVFVDEDVFVKTLHMGVRPMVGDLVALPAVKESDVRWVKVHEGYVEVGMGTLYSHVNDYSWVVERFLDEGWSVRGKAGKAG